MDTLFDVSFFIVLFFVLDFFDWSWEWYCCHGQSNPSSYASIAVKAMRTGVAISHILIDSKAGRKRVRMYEIVMIKQSMKISNRCLDLY